MSRLSEQSKCGYNRHIGVVPHDFGVTNQVIHTTAGQQGDNRNCVESTCGARSVSLNGCRRSFAAWKAPRRYPRDVRPIVVATPVGVGCLCCRQRWRGIRAWATRAPGVQDASSNRSHRCLGNPDRNSDLADSYWPFRLAKICSDRLDSYEFTDFPWFCGNQQEIFDRAY